MTAIMTAYIDCTIHTPPDVCPDVRFATNPVAAPRHLGTFKPRDMETAVGRRRARRIVAWFVKAGGSDVVVAFPLDRCARQSRPPIGSASAHIINLPRMRGAA